MGAIPPPALEEGGMVASSLKELDQPSLGA
jgi:hypothetical protein